MYPADRVPRFNPFFVMAISSGTDYGRRPGAPGVCSKPSIARARARARRVRIDVQKILGTY
jgi:hypothetical protein